MELSLLPDDQGGAHRNRPIPPILVGGLVAGSVLLARLVVMEPENWLPRSPWHTVTLGSLLLSLFSAFVFYYDYPHYYRHLKLRGLKYAFVYFLVPSFQLLAVAIAALTLDQVVIHAGATALYLFLFLPWDLVIATAEIKEDDESTARQFKARALSYFQNIDTPTFLAFTGLWFFSSVVNSTVSESVSQAHPQPAVGAFMAGVVGSQALAGLVIVSFQTWEKMSSSWNWPGRCKRCRVGCRRFRRRLRDLVGSFISSRHPLLRARDPKGEAERWKDRRFWP